MASPALSIEHLAREIARAERVVARTGPWAIEAARSVEAKQGQTAKQLADIPAQEFRDRLTLASVAKKKPTPCEVGREDV